MKTLTQTNMKKIKSRFNDQHKLKIVCDDLCDNIEDLFDALGISNYKLSQKMITCSCPIHEGNNNSALNLYHVGDRYRGNWKCRTHSCEEIFKSSIIGFIRGVLSKDKYNWQKEGDKTCSFDEAVNFALDFLRKDISQYKISKKDKNKTDFTNVINCIKNVNPTTSVITRNTATKTLQYPCNYFIDRGFNTDILKRYDVGLCFNPKKPMYNRAVVPIYDESHQFLVGCSGRSIFEKCQKCGCYHDHSSDCPSENESWKYSKWKHSADFKSQDNLYNFWFAKEHIKRQKYAIIVESPGNVWKLEEAGIHNSVAVFGSSLSDNQKRILDVSGAMSLVLIMDNDEAGKKATEQIIKKCQRTYNVYALSITHEDVGSMSKNEIILNIIPQLEKLPL
jgi:5S rRNA maturation endonuclease (ribonuclease M5)